MAFIRKVKTDNSEITQLLYRKPDFVAVMSCWRPWLQLAPAAGDRIAGTLQGAGRSILGGEKYPQLILTLHRVSYQHYFLSGGWESHITLV